MGLVYRALVTHLIRNGYIKLRHTGAVTMTQQFGSAMTAYSCRSPVVCVGQELAGVNE
jgi:hypothetical protein